VGLKFFDSQLLYISFTSKIFMRLKVFVNKRTGQAIIMLPKKKLKKIPKFVDVRSSKWL